MITIVDVTAANVSDVGVCCVKDKKSPGYKAKIDWFKLKINEGLTIKLALDDAGKQVGFIEYLPSELAWRPIKAANYLFIQCIAIYVKDIRNTGIASMLINECMKDAEKLNKSGICVMTSDGPWMANNKLFIKNNFNVVDKLDRFELLSLKLNESVEPTFINWNSQRAGLTGWNLVYSDQCPWHEKSVNDLMQASKEYGLNLKVLKLTTPGQAQMAPSGFGTFSLIKDGKLLADHYISKTRFKNIIDKELEFA